MGGGQRLVMREASEGEEEEEEMMVLKNSIASHPMFELLKETHLDCLKVCMGEQEEADRELSEDCRECNITEGFSELDLFMRAYYMTLLGLKQAIQQPMIEASAFIGLMQYLLEELTHPIASFSAAGEIGGGCGGELCDQCGGMTCCSRGVEEEAAALVEEMEKLGMGNEVLEEP